MGNSRDKRAPALSSGMRLLEAELAIPAAIEATSYSDRSTSWPIAQEMDSTKALATKILSAKTDEERDALLNSTPDVSPKKIIENLIQLETAQHGQSEVRQALEVNRWAAKLAEASGDEASLFELSVASGTMQSALGGHQEAIGLYQTALSAATSLAVC